MGRRVVLGFLIPTEIESGRRNVCILFEFFKLILFIVKIIMHIHLQTSK